MNSFYFHWFGPSNVRLHFSSDFQLQVRPENKQKHLRPVRPRSSINKQKQKRKYEFTINFQQSKKKSLPTIRIPFPKPFTWFAAPSMPSSLLESLLESSGIFCNVLTCFACSHSTARTSGRKCANNYVTRSHTSFANFNFDRN